MSKKSAHPLPYEGVSKSAEDFTRLGLRTGNIPDAWEDGMRTEPDGTNYEWWYFDAHLDDGSTLVVVFFPKPMAPMRKGLAPMINIEFDRPDGTSYKRDMKFGADEFSAAKDQCDVKIAHNYFRGDLEQYEIHVRDERIDVKLDVVRTTDSWRADTGHQFFGEKRDVFGAWLVPVPQGRVRARIALDGKEEALEGSCYHDHNWGNVNMMDVRNHWYWARTELGPYTVVTADMVAHKKYGYATTFNFYLARDGKTVADDRDKVDGYRSAPRLQEDFGKPMSDNLKYVYGSPEDDVSYVLTLKKDHNISAMDLLSKAIHNRYVLSLFKLFTGLSSAYYRMIGEARLDVYHQGKLVETHVSNKAIWELMYFGDPIGTD